MRGALHDRLIERVFAVLCVGGNRWMDLSDYVQSVAILVRGSNEDRLKLFFAIFDVDDDGLLSAHDLFVALEWHFDALLPDDFAILSRCFDAAAERVQVRELVKYVPG